MQQALKVFFALGAKQRYRQGGVPQFHIKKANTCDLKCGVIQINYKWKSRTNLEQSWPNPGRPLPLSSAPSGCKSWIFTGAQPLGNVPLVPVCQQMLCQHFPEIVIDAVQIGIPTGTPL